MSDSENDRPIWRFGYAAAASLHDNSAAKRNLQAIVKDRRQELCDELLPEAWADTAEEVKLHEVAVARGMEGHCASSSMNSGKPIHDGYVVPAPHEVRSHPARTRCGLDRMSESN